MVIRIYYSEGTSEPLLSLDGKEARLAPDDVLESAKSWVNAEIERMVAMSEQIVITVERVLPPGFEEPSWKLPLGEK